LLLYGTALGVGSLAPKPTFHSFHATHEATQQTDRRLTISPSRLVPLLHWVD